MSLKFKALLLDNVDPSCEQVFKKRGIDAVNAPKLKGDDLLSELPEYDAIVVRSATKVTKELLKVAEKLKVVGRAGVGVDNIDIEAATEAGVLVMNTPDGNTISTAEHTCGMILALARNIPPAVQSVKEGRWDRKKYMGTEIHGKTLGIVGLGKIGSAVAERMKAFGMDILAYDPFTTHDRAEQLGIKLVDMDQILAKSDFLTVHTPLTEKTKGLISLSGASKIKKGIRLINCARGGIIKEADIPELLNSGIVSGISIDVYSEEPPSEKLYEILKDPRIVSTPHLGASTEEAQEKVAYQVAEQIADALEHKNYKGSINGKSIALSTNKEVQPYLKMAEQLGKFTSQVAPKHTKTFSIEYAGSCSQYAEVLTDAILQGYLHGEVEDVNLINARFLADQRGLTIQETKTSASKTYADMVTVRFGDNAAYKNISAAVFGHDDFRIVEIDGFAIEIRLEGDIILYRNVDKPGMLAAVSSALASEEINIAALSLGRTRKGSNAITAVSVDKRLKPKELEPIEKLNGIDAVHYISI